MDRLKKRWGIASNFQLAVIFTVFAINGSLSARISYFLMELVGLTKQNTHWLLYYLILLAMVLPLYPFMLMAFGWLFGQSPFFFPFAKKMIRGMKLGFLLPKEKARERQDKS